MLIQFLSLLAMALAMYGSKLFVKSNFDLGSKMFIVGNTINILLGLAIGNIYLSIAQLGLLVFTLPMVKVNTNKRFYSLVGLLGIGLGICLPMHIGFDASVIDVLSTLCAWYGAYKMSKGDYTTMAKCWIVADIGFIYIGVTERLLGLTIQAMVFTYHGYLRIKG